MDYRCEHVVHEDWLVIACDLRCILPCSVPFQEKKKASEGLERHASGSANLLTLLQTKLKDVAGSGTTPTGLIVTAWVDVRLVSHANCASPGPGWGRAAA